ncbi:cytochrome c1 [Marivibrio halodurans]|uniref:Cytochrome c1 n=1 Tax=Marivibrio halodurans TaxID=2039722 RepID=A0A8J7S655_9PROT|nr:cytochrome c1 [Marivibrio halodurans]MBP5856297.1 cytochrome c1 [Marivibrio halodurans]
MAITLKGFALGVATAAVAGTIALSGMTDRALAAGEAEHPPELDWSWTGPFGTFDRASAQRGLQVYSQVCASCHGLGQLYYRDLTGLGYTEDQVAEFAAQYQVEDGPNDQGEMYMRPAEPSDHFVEPFPNEAAARAANGGAHPPDLSLIIKNRAHGFGSIGENFLAMLQVRGYSSGADYVHGLLAEGYVDPPEDVNLLPGQYYNKFMGSGAIGMPPPLYPDGVEYEDGTEATVDQQARDVSTFLAWAAEPRLEARKQTGVKVLIFLAIFTGILIAVKRRTWASVKH